MVILVGKVGKIGGWAGWGLVNLTGTIPTVVGPSPSSFSSFSGSSSYLMPPTTCQRNISMVAAGSGGPPLPSSFPSHSPGLLKLTNYLPRKRKYCGGWFSSSSFSPFFTASLEAIDNGRNLFFFLKCAPGSRRYPSYRMKLYRPPVGLP
jgi:hypothetical protein